MLAELSKSVDSWGPELYLGPCYTKYSPWASKGEPAYNSESLAPTQTIEAEFAF